MRTILGLVMCWVLSALFMAGPAIAAEGLDAKTRPLWERHWRVYARRCAEFEGGFLCCPKYDRRYPSGAGMTVRQAEKVLSAKVKERGGGLIVTRTVKMPRAEAEALARPLPRLAVGEYGLLASVEVDEVLGPTSMLVKDLYLIDPADLRRDFKADRAKARRSSNPSASSADLEQIYKRRRALADRQKRKPYRAVMRLEGFSTDTLEPGERWSGPDSEGIRIVIFRPETYGSERRSKRRLVAVNLQAVHWGLDEAGFARLLEARELSPSGFVSLIQEKMAEDDPDDAQQRVFTALLPGLADSREVPEDEKGDADGDGSQAQPTREQTGEQPRGPEDTASDAP